MNVIDRVERLVREHGTRNPFELCEILNISIMIVPLIDLRGFYMCEEGVDIIFLSSELSQHTSSFVCGHELAHCIYDKGLNRPFLDKWTYCVPGKYENRADKFSAHLHWGGSPLFEEQCLSDLEMADCLNVPVHSLNSRLVELGIYY